MALEQSKAAPNSIQTATGFLIVAFLQEADGLDQYPQTIDALVDALRQIDSDPRAVEEAMEWGLTGVSMADRFVIHSENPSQKMAPKSMNMVWKILHDLRLEADPGANPLEGIESLYDHGLTGDIATIRARLAVAREDEILEMAGWAAEGLLESGDPAKAYSLKDFVPSGAFEDEYRERVFMFHLRKKDFHTAVAEARLWPTRFARVGALSRAALEMASARYIDEAVELASDIEFFGIPREWTDVRVELAEVYARAGDRELSSRLLESTDFPSSDIDNWKARQIDRVQLIAALVASDFELARTILLRLDRADIDQDLMFSIDAYLGRGHREIDAFIASLPQDYLPDALMAVGYYQIESEDLDGALKTFSRLRSLVNLTEPGFDMRISLIPLMVRNGMTVEGVRLADELGIPTVTARVAALIE